jgi:hypothetical protein
MNKNLRPYVVSIDWLQLHCTVRRISLRSARGASLFADESDKKRFSFHSVGHGSKTYSSIYLVKQRGVEWAELSINPYSSSIHPLSSTLKLKNKVLYEPNLMADIADFVEFLGFRYIGITRLDLAYDCSRFRVRSVLS